MTLRGSSVKHLDCQRLRFSVFSEDEIKNLSVIKIRTPMSFNVLGHPLKGGLYDPALGPLNDRSDPCATCGNGSQKCPGHFGHIELPLPVVNPLCHKELHALLKLSCLKCHTLQIAEYMKCLIITKLKLMRHGFLSNVEGLEQEVMAGVADTENFVRGGDEYIKEIIENYLMQLNVRERCPDFEDTEEALTYKDLPVQWYNYIEKLLKHLIQQKGKKCLYCHEMIPKVTVTVNNEVRTTSMRGDEARGTVQRAENTTIMPQKSQQYLRKIWLNEEVNNRDIVKVLIPCIGMVNCETPTDIFFFNVVPVLPPIVRPCNVMQGQILEHPQTQVYKSIVQEALVLKTVIQAMQQRGSDNLSDEGKLLVEQIAGASLVEKLQRQWAKLQSTVDRLMDREMSKTPDSANCQGLKQIIEKKEGIIRMHMMGKRVNYAARSVITPDPNLNIDEIGVPEAFARKLTYPVPVTPWNVTELRQLVINGPENYPGAVMVEHEDGKIMRINEKEKTQREALAKRLLTTSDKANRFFGGIKIVHRHLQNGDIMLLNRQPTLHKSSIMAHKAKILKGEKTLRLHYANCKSYNADFDGDEMNAHFPQNELGRSEGYFIANVSNQYLVPKDGTPLSGLIQDHMVSGVRMSKRGMFYNRSDYMQLVFSALSSVQGEIVTLPPAIVKPVPLWSGKQILSTVIINVTPRDKAKINLTSTSKINEGAWQARKPRKWKCGEQFANSKTMSEAEVIVRNGELLCGVLDKTHYGATPYGLIHCIYELYGGVCSSTLLSAFGKLFQSYLQREAFTLGVEDILVNSKPDEKRREIVEDCRKIGDQVQKSALELEDATIPSGVIREKIEEAYWGNPKFRAQLDRKYKSALDIYTNNINKTCLPAGLTKKFPENNLQLMVQSGAKGSTVNTMQISCLLGQIELEGKRPPLMISGKSLPSFPPYESSPRAGGFIDMRFMTGIQPQEFFFHCMAGREGLIDTAVKTSRSGYLQRCLVKHLEGLVVNYDSTVRNSDGSLVQMLYGEDGLDIANSRFLTKEQIGFLVDNKEAILDRKLVKNLKDDAELSKILKIKKKVQKWEKKNGSATIKTRGSGFALYSEENKSANPDKYKSIDMKCGRNKAALSAMKKWVKKSIEEKEVYEDKCKRCPDPAIGEYRQDLEFGVLSERLEKLMDNYLKADKGSIDKVELRDLICMKLMKTLSQPGEPVGLLAAQSIGEPSTQMTLNTFHFAGRGEMNVTLGIPRLREILMMASRNIKTPSMEIPFLKTLRNVNKQATKLKLKLTRCTLADVLRDVKVDRIIEDEKLVYTLTVNLLPYKCYKHEFCVKPENVVERTEDTFFKEIFREVKKLAKLTGTLWAFHTEEKKTSDEDDSRLDEAEPEEPVDNGRKSKFKTDFGEDHESSDEEEAAEDADATTARTMGRHDENQEYDDSDSEGENDPEPRGDDEEKQEKQGENFDEEDEDVTMVYHGRDEMQNKKRRNKVVDMYDHAMEYDFDSESWHWCKLKFWLPMRMMKLDFSTVVKNAAKNTVLSEVQNIKRAFTFQNNDGDPILKTDGINIVEMFKYNKILDLQKLYSNDIFGISQTYGIEAANRIIVREVKEVFKVYGITVDPRHLLLIADYMTFDGTFQPLSRKGMDQSSSPLQQISFESSLNFLRNATIQGKQDNLESPSSRLMVGKPCKAGTGCFSLLTKINLQIQPLAPTKL